MSDYTLTPKEYARLKSNLTRAKGDFAKTIKACREAHAIFEEKGYPDDWARWQGAWDDATVVAVRSDLRDSYHATTNPFWR